MHVLSRVQIGSYRVGSIRIDFFGSGSIRVGSFRFQFFRIKEIQTQKVFVNFRFGFGSGFRIQIKMPRPILSVWTRGSWFETEFYQKANQISVLLIKFVYIIGTFEYLGYFGYYRYCEFFFYVRIHDFGFQIQLWVSDNILNFQENILVIQIKF